MLHGSQTLNLIKRGKWDLGQFGIRENGNLQNEPEASSVQLGNAACAAVGKLQFCKTNPAGLHSAVMVSSDWLFLGNYILQNEPETRQE